MPSSDSEKTSADHQSTFEKSSSSTSSVGLGQDLVAALQGVNFKDNLFYMKLTVEDLEAIKTKFNLPSPFEHPGKASYPGKVAPGTDSPHSPDSYSSMHEPDSMQAPHGVETGLPAPLGMNLHEWVTTITSMFGTPNIAEDAAAMFKQMDASRGRGVVQWEDVLDLYMEFMPPSSLHKDMQYLVHRGHFNRIEHAKRETLQKILGVDTGITYVYILVSKFGHVGIYDDKLRLQRKYDIDIDTDPNADLDVGASDPGWVTDAIWMENSKHAAYSTSLRTMHFFDASASVHYEEYRVFGFLSIPTCLDFSFDPNQPDGESLLLFGDDSGGVTSIAFKQPLNSLFHKNEVDNVQCVFWPEMSRHEEFVVVDYTPRIHADGVLGLKFLRHNGTVVTTSRDPEASLVIRHLKGKFQTYVFKLHWGVRCFDIAFTNQGLCHVVTGSNDKIVRLWTQVVVSRPILVFSGHKYGLTDVKIHTDLSIVISYDKRAVIKVWDMAQGFCLQTLALSFPCFKVLGKEIEFGRPSMYIESAPPNSCFASCCDFLAVLRFGDPFESDLLAEENNSIGLGDSQAQVWDTAQGLGTITNHLTPVRARTPTTLGRYGKRIAPSVSPGSLGTYGGDQSSMPSNPSMVSRGSKATDVSQSSGWSSVRNIIRNRRAGKLRHHPSIETDAEYEQFNYFQRNLHPSEDTLNSSLNELRVIKYLNNEKMRQLAKDKMPFLGLEICGLQTLSFPQDLPMSSSMVQKGLRINSLQELLDAPLEDNSSSTLVVGPVGGTEAWGRGPDSGPRKISSIIRKEWSSSGMAMLSESKALPIISERMGDSIPGRDLTLLSQ